MDFHRLSRKELQGLCKKNKIPANITNIAMADALKALEKVEGLDELTNAIKSDPLISPGKTTPGSPDIPQTAPRMSTQRNPTDLETETSQPLTRTRRTTRRTIATEVDQGNENANLPETPAIPTNRRRATAVSSRQKKEAKVLESGGLGKVLLSNSMETPSKQSSRRRAPALSGLGKMEAQNEGRSVQSVYGTRQSVRLLEKSMAELSLKGKGKVEAAKKKIEYVDNNKIDSENYLLAESGEGLDRSLEDKSERSRGLQEEYGSNEEHERDDCNPNLGVGNRNCNNLYEVSGLNGEDKDSNYRSDKSKIQAENSTMAVNMSYESSDEKEIYLLTELGELLGRSLENGSELSNGLQKKNSSEYEGDDCNHKLEVRTQKCSNFYVVSGLDGEDKDSNDRSGESKRQAENSAKALEMSYESIEENGPHVLISWNSSALDAAAESGIENDLKRKQVSLAVERPDDRSVMVKERARTSVDVQDSAGFMDHVLAKQFSTPSESNKLLNMEEIPASDSLNSSATKFPGKFSKRCLTDDLQSKSEENVSDEVQEYEETETAQRKTPFVGQDVLNYDSERGMESKKCEEFSADHTNFFDKCNNEALVDVDVIEAEELAIPWESTRETAPRTGETCSENLFDINIMPAEEFSCFRLPTALDKKAPANYQISIAAETVPSRIPSDSLQGQFHRPSESIPRKLSAKTPVNKENIGKENIEMMNHASLVNKKGTENNNRIVEAGKDEAIKKALDQEISHDLSLRLLRKMLKEKLQISVKNSEEETVNTEKRTRLPLQTVSENSVLGVDGNR